MKTVRWIIGAVMLASLGCVIALMPVSWDLGRGLPYGQFSVRCIYIILLATALCVYRVWEGPTAADRVVAIDILGVLIVGFCAVAATSTGRSWYIDIGIAWALHSFIGALALSKYLEGRPLDE